MFCFLQVFCVLFSAALVSLGIPNEFFETGNAFFGLISLVPLFIAISRSKSYRMSFFLGFIHAGVTHLFSSYWLKNFHGFAIFTLGASLIGTAFIEGFVFLIMHYAYSSQKNDFLSSSEKFSPYNMAVKIFWGPAVYVIYEWCKSNGFLGYPWGTVSMSAVSSRYIVQIADITGAYGITFLFAIASSCIAWGIILLRKEISITYSNDIFCYKNAVLFLGAIFTVSLCYGFFKYHEHVQPVKNINTVMVQHNQDTYSSNEETSILKAENLTLEGIDILRSQELKPDLVVWSEGILNRYFPKSQHYYENFPYSSPLMTFVKKQNVPFIMGGALTIDAENHKYGNAAALITNKGEYAGSYIKLHLVPFAEAIPFVEYEPVRKFIKKIAGFSYGWTAGSSYTLFEIPISDKNAADTRNSKIIYPDLKKNKLPPSTVKVSSPICFDDAFPSVCRGLFLSGCELFMNITNDSWSKTRSAEYQHFAIAFYRAIEYRTTLARCTNSGFTVVVNPQGKITGELPLFEENVLAMQIPIYKPKMTVYAKFGNWLPYSLIVLVFFFIVAVEIQIEKEKITEISVECATKRKRGTKVKK